MSKWQGTPVPNSGQVDNIYINTKLSKEEVVNICDNLTFVDGSSVATGFDIWSCATNSDLTNGIMIARSKINPEIYAITVTSSDGVNEIFFSTIGWTESASNVLEFNTENQIVQVGSLLGFTPENEKASMLFSITPFKDVSLNSFLTGIADAIRSKKGTNDKINASNFASEIESIESGGGSSEEYPNEAIKYYKENRNKNYPYFPLPSEMTDEQDTIYMLYGASGYMCCPVFNITFTECVCTIQKYINTTLVSEYVESVTSNTTKYLQFSEEDSDYSTYNYIVIKMQGNITKHYLNYKPKFNGVEYNSYTSSELLEVSGKCVGCNIKVVSNISDKTHQNLEYYSFLGVTTTDMSSMFNSCYSLQTIPLLDTSNVTDMSYMFNSCYSLQTIPLLDTSNVTNMRSMFYYCYILQTIPLLDTSNVTDMSYMFNSCYSLQTIPLLDTSNVTDMRSMFNNCYILQTIPQLNTSNVTNMSYMFNSCGSLQTIPLLDTSKVTNMSGMFKNCYILCKLDIINMKFSFNLNNSTMLTTNELVKILNNLATVETTQTLTLGSTLLAKLTKEQKAIATAKGWTLA